MLVLLKLYLCTIPQLTLDVVFFLKSSPPVEPVSFTHSVVKSMEDPNKRLPSRFIKRMTPISLVCKATQGDILATAKRVLEPVFNLAAPAAPEASAAPEALATPAVDLTQNQPVDKQLTEVVSDANTEQAAVGSNPTLPSLGEPSKILRYRIVPTLRNHSSPDINRDWLIQSIAALVSELGHDQHKVDLKNADKSIIVDVYQTVCGISVVGGDYDELKKYNLAEVQGAAIKKAYGK